MKSRIAINGLGRIGRALLRLTIDEPSLELVAVNDLVDAATLAYLLRYDTVYGRYSKSVSVNGTDLVVADRRLRTLRTSDPLELPWKELEVDVVFECTGALTRREDLEKHVRAGARFVLLSAPSKGGGWIR
jgi:glyceraldehyde 3-phosphate dehydrogenase